MKPDGHYLNMNVVENTIAARAVYSAETLAPGLTSAFQMEFLVTALTRLRGCIGEVQLTNATFLILPVVHGFPKLRLTSNLAGENMRQDSVKNLCENTSKGEKAQAHANGHCQGNKETQHPVFADHIWGHGYYEEHTNCCCKRQQVC
jgi:hypothetical protein